jgi:para-aminobenzoate synthetase component 1
VFALDGGGAASWGSGRALLGFRPRATLRVAAGGEAAVRAGGVERRWRGDPFTLLDRFCAECGPPAASRAGSAAPADDPERLAGGVVAALSYDLRRWVEGPRPGARPAVAPAEDPALPVLHAAADEWLLSYSYRERRYQLVSASPSRRVLRAAAEEIERLAARPAPAPMMRSRARIVSDVTREQYLAAVGAVLEYIAAGDVYQVNFAQRFVVHDPPPPAALFATMQRTHAVPFAAYVDAGDCVLVSNSPECFLMRNGDALATFPVKGTRPRGVDAPGDVALARELHEDPKERAEHLMIVDLERNDLGRICCTGSVRVEEFARTHSFPSLHHMVSKVAGRLPPHTPLAAVLRATFPGGSITGAPKIRAMEIIDALEPVRRGFYTGAIGFIGRDGSAVFNLAIRTAVVTRRTIAYHAGGGIVADSIPLREYEETLLKAHAFFAALTAAAA